MEFILGMATLALRILIVVAGFWVFREILRNGPTTVKEVLATIGVLVRVACVKTRRYIAEKLRKERLETEEPEAETDDTVEGEGSVV